MTDNQMSQFNIFLPVVKVDYNKRQVWGRMTHEIPDGGREVMDYASSKPNFEQWSAAAKMRTALLPEDQQSMGNLRAMHQPISAGKVIDVEYKDAEKAIDIGTYVQDDDSWDKVLKGVYTGFSIGGGYGKRWLDPSNPTLTRYTAIPVEVSLVDSPAVPTATFTMIKADGTSELRKLGEAITIMQDSESNLPPESINDASNPVVNPNTPPIVNVDSSDGDVKVIPTVADHFVSPNLIVNDATAVKTPDSNPATPEVDNIEVLKAFTAAVQEFVALKNKQTEAKTKQETLLKALGSRVGIARRESESLSAQQNQSSVHDDYGDPANWQWPMDNPTRCYAAIVGFNKGQNRSQYADREWHVLGRRIANRASEVFGMRYQYQPVSKLISNEGLNKMEMNKDVAGLMAQLKAGIDVAVDQIGKDPNAAKDMLMSLLGNLDASDNSKAVNPNTSNPTPPPHGGGQGDGVGKAEVVAKDQLPPVAAADEAPEADESEMSEAKKVTKALEIKVDDLASKFEKLMAALTPPTPAPQSVTPVVAKNSPVGDLQGLLPNNTPTINPVIAMLTSGDKNALQKAAVLAGTPEKPDVEAVMKLAQEYAEQSLKPNFTKMMIANGLAQVPTFTN